MQQKNLTNTVHDPSIRHDVTHTPSGSPWVVDSKRLVPGKWSEAMVHKGCDCGGGGGCPAVNKNN
jgi:hypothetical protein